MKKDRVSCIICNRQILIQRHMLDNTRVSNFVTGLGLFVFMGIIFAIFILDIISDQFPFIDIVCQTLRILKATKYSYC